MAEFRFFCVFGLSGVRALVFFSGTPKRPKMPKNWIWGLVEAVSGKFSGDLKVAHGDSATDEPKKSGFWAVGPDLCPKYRFARALAVGPMPRNLRT